MQSSQQSVLISVLALALSLTGVLSNGHSTSGGSPPAGQYNGSPSALTGAQAGQQTAASPGSAFQPGQPATIAGNLVNLRPTPDESAPVSAKAPRGTVVTVQAEQDGWLQVTLPNGQSGWVADWLVDRRAPRTLPAQPPVDDGAIAGQPGGGQPSNGGRRLVLGKKEVIGYYTVEFADDRDSYNSMVSNSNYLTGIAPFLFSVDAYGNVTGKHSQEAVTYARSRGLKALALVHNLSNGDFSANTVHNLLSYESNRKRAIDGILGILRAYGYDGVNIDFEAVPARDREALSTFMRELAFALRPAGYLTTISMPAKAFEDYSSSWGGAFDYRTIGQYADLVMLMTYDEHYRYGEPGPVASVGWVEDVIRFTVNRIPREKVLIGIPAYGYDWPGNGGPATTVTYDSAMSLARRLGIAPRWDDSAKVPYFTYWDKSGLR
ncbi:MAG: glycosyl hydrolase family 18 protein, partial [Syntrophothermus sp.]